LEINIGELCLVTIPYTTVAKPAPRNAPESGTPQIYAISAVAVKQLSINCSAKSKVLPSGGLSFTL
jgi:hypothetical protein